MSERPSPVEGRQLSWTLRVQAHSDSLRETSFSNREGNQSPEYPLSSNDAAILNRGFNLQFLVRDCEPLAAVDIELRFQSNFSPLRSTAVRRIMLLESRPQQKLVFVRNPTIGSQKGQPRVRPSNDHLGSRPKLLGFQLILGKDARLRWDALSPKAASATSRLSDVILHWPEHTKPRFSPI